MSETREDRIACGPDPAHRQNVVRFRPRENRDAFERIVLDGVFVSTPRGPALTVRIRFRTRLRAWTAPVFSVIGQQSGHIHSEIPALLLSTEQVGEIRELFDSCVDLAPGTSITSSGVDDLQSTLLALFEGRSSGTVSDEVLSKLHCKLLHYRRAGPWTSRSAQ